MFRHQEQRIDDCGGISRQARVYIAGHLGLVGRALHRRLERAGFEHIITRTFEELDLRNEKDVHKFFDTEQPEYVFLAAAKVGGIKANMDYPAYFIYDNLAIQTNVIHASYLYSVKKLLFLGSSCIYPRDCPQPIKEEYLLTGLLEPTNAPYAVAKIAGITLCQSYNTQYGTRFMSCMPTNLYGPYDNFNLETSHIIPALIAKMYAAHRQGEQAVTVWGSGKPYREFLFVDDLADAALFLMDNDVKCDLINVGVGTDITIAELARLIQNIIGFKGTLVFDAQYPDGTPRKLLSVDKLHALGWRAPTSLQEGLKRTIAWYDSYYGERMFPHVCSETTTYTGI